jgi:hypothetical protein
LNKTEPAKYVEYVLGLAEGGIGRLGPQEINVKSDAALLRSYKNNQDTSKSTEIRREILLDLDMEISLARI